MEVIYTRPWQRIDAVINAALEEDVDVIGISSLATDHLLVPKLMDALRAADLAHVQVIVGGIVPSQDEARLIEVGVKRVFHPCARRSEIVEAVRELAKSARSLEVPDGRR
jgi:methylmalonyl-CoA mutase C-terminal domain/subunit